MNSKIIPLVLLTAILLSLSVVSAEMTSILKGPDFSKSNNLSYFELTNVYGNYTNITISSPLLQINDGSNHYLTINLNPSALNYNLALNDKIRINATLIRDPSFIFNFGTSYVFPTINITTINSTNSSITEPKTAIFSFINSFCDYGELPTNATWLEITRINDENLDNEDEWDWAPLDDIEISIKIANRYTDDLDVTLEYGLYNPETREFLDLDEESIDVSIDEGEVEEVIINFQIPADAEASSSYRFYVKAYEEGNEDGVCVAHKTEGSEYYKSNVEIRRESRAAILDSIKIDSSALCGDEVELNAKIYNTGRGDEDKVLITLYNKELGININKVVENLDPGDSESISFSFKIPENATEKSYTLALTTYFKYDDDNSGCSNDEDKACYDKNSFSDLDEDFKATLKVEGNCIKPVPAVTDKVDVTASLQSEEAIAGEEIVIKANIKNSGIASQTYAILVSGAENFAVVQKIEPQSFTLDAGKSQDVLITLKANADAAGDYTFNLKVSYGSKTKEQPVSLTIEAKSGFLSKLTGLAFLENFKGNWFIWVIVAINVILIILIIVVIAKLAKTNA